MIEKIIDWSSKNRIIVLFAYVLLVDMEFTAQRTYLLTRSLTYRKTRLLFLRSTWGGVHR